MSKGRLTLCLTAFDVGSDLLVLLTGGEAHIGAFVCCDPSMNMGHFEFNGHREKNVATEVATIIAGATARKVAVACGIHYNNITKQEIQDIQLMSSELARQMGHLMNNRLSHISVPW